MSQPVADQKTQKMPTPHLEGVPHIRGIHPCAVDVAGCTSLDNQRVGIAAAALRFKDGVVKGGCAVGSMHTDQIGVLAKLAQAFAYDAHLQGNWGSEREPLERLTWILKQGGAADVTHIICACLAWHTDRLHLSRGSFNRQAQRTPSDHT